MQPTQEAGNVWLPDPAYTESKYHDPEIEIYLSELSAFPGVPHDDETDATTQYVNWARVRDKTMGLVEYMKQQMTERKAA